MSDIRILEVDSFPTDFDVLTCNSMQFNWINILKPYMASLKFRQPFYSDNSVKNITDIPECYGLSKEYGIDFIKDYHDKKMTYLMGKFYLQAWSGPTSSETRLLVDSNDRYMVHDVDIQLYEDSLYYYNKIQRTKEIFRQPQAGCYTCGDCALESYIITAYCDKYKTQDFESVKLFLNKTFKHIH
jgi:hypothetical protein